MQNNNNNVCRFCLKLVHGESVQSINNEATNKMLGVLLIKLDLDVSEDPLMCKMCSDILDEIFSFKLKCLNSENVTSNNHFKRYLQVSLSKILIGKAPDINADYEVICGLCKKYPPNGTYISLNATGGQISFCRNVIQSHLPEVDLRITKEPVICNLCHKVLNKYRSFVTRCMDVERKIKLYCDLQGINNKEQVNLGYVLNLQKRPYRYRQCATFTANRTVNCESSLNEDLVIKQEEGFVFGKLQKTENEDNLSEDHFVDSISTELCLRKEKVVIEMEDDQMRSDMVQFTEERLHVTSDAVHPILEHSYCKPFKGKIIEECLLSLAKDDMHPCSSYGKQLERELKYYPSKCNFCKFCKILILRLGRHLAWVHMDEVEVQKFLMLPASSILRRNIYDKIRIEGNFLFNTINISNSKAVISVMRSFNNVLKYQVLCPRCRTIFSNKRLRHHILHCCPLLRSTQVNWK